VTEPARPFELSACVEWLFAEAGPELPERIRAAAAAGVPAVEFWTLRGRDVDAIAAALAETGTALSGFLANPAAPLVDRAAHPAAVEEVEAAVDVAGRLGCRTLIALAGDALAGVDAAMQRAALVDGLRACAAIAGPRGVTLALEPLNSRVDHVGTFLDSTRAGLDVVDEVGSPHVRLLLDLYHALVMEEDWAADARGRGDRIAHVHVADVPGRHEPGAGTANWPQALAELADLGYRGRIGLEYVPTGPTATTLDVIRRAAGEAAAGR
jgi:hydroxypyruvate isomerase